MVPAARTGPRRRAITRSFLRVKCPHANEPRIVLGRVPRPLGPRCEELEVRDGVLALVFVGVERREQRRDLERHQHVGLLLETLGEGLLFVVTVGRKASRHC